ncbi:P-loop containing nucleoside triphosphate hydrolase protein [Sporormia fimetaria CBS 119925]|uniref:P-loop containing nucleoside triphosphate hydrolase protein n=1 Tax=Sporormia fimetaria CBS 119925 TaxID=1340428 RepID=A0A6A6VDM2_9PLEO|nr:P-loop containing nucleoside triphosphate hydrolase protein [Sporormia fimetaria CBS 119925]
MARDDWRTSTVTFNEIHTAFTPGVLVVTMGQLIEEVYRFREVNLRKGRWEFVVERFQHDGASFGWVPREPGGFIYNDPFSIGPYSGHKRLVDLPIFPLKYHPHYEDARRHLLANGKKYTSLVGHHFQVYKCGTDQAVSVLEGNVKNPPHLVMIDAEKYYENTCCKKPQLEPTSAKARRRYETARFKDEEYLACPPLALGFSLVAGSWQEFRVERLYDVGTGVDTLELLTRCQPSRDIVRSLAQCSRTIIESKGAGTVIMLHGPPGVGKSFTAKLVSEFLQRPLYTVPCREYSSSRLATDLPSMLQLATRWDAVVLLKNVTSVKPDIISAATESFDGVLFLTVTLPDTIDQSLLTRVHLQLAYPKLSAQSRRHLWTLFIRNGSQQAPPKWLDDAFLSTLSRADLNAHHIKNSIRIAHALAQHRNRSIQPSDVLSGVKCMIMFSKEHARRPSRERDKSHILFGACFQLPKTPRRRPGCPHPGRAFRTESFPFELPYVWEAGEKKRRLLFPPGRCCRECAELRSLCARLRKTVGDSAID